MASIVNNNIRLEEIAYNHAFIVFEAIDTNRTFLSEWLPFVEQTKCQEDTELFIRSVLNASKDNKEKVFIIWYKDYFAGLIGLKDIDSLNYKTEIGYWLIEAMTGKGIMKQSVKTLVDFVFKTHNINRIQIKCAIGNDRSSAIPKRLGFHFEGIERAGERYGNRFFDLEIYSILRDEWSQKLLK